MYILLLLLKKKILTDYLRIRISHFIFYIEMFFRHRTSDESGEEI